MTPDQRTKIMEPLSNARSMGIIKEISDVTVKLAKTDFVSMEIM